MKLIDRYVYDVTRRLPEKQRSDVARELKSEIIEMVEARSKNNVFSEKHAYVVLSELGSPSRLADRYRERPRFLIGPDYFEPYVQLLKMLLMIILPIVAFVVWMTEAMTVDHTIVSIVTKVIGTIFEVGIHIFFWTTISFFIVDKVSSGTPHDDGWKPDDLPQLPPEQEITRGESYFAIAWSVLAVLAITHQIPAVYEVVGLSDVPQFFADTMWPYWTLGLLAISLLGLVVEIIKMIIGGWTKLTVLLIIVINSITIGFFLALVTQVQPIANPDMMQLIVDSLGKTGIADSVDLGIKIFVGVVVAICCYEIAEAIYKYKKGGKV